MKAPEPYLVWQDPDDSRSPGKPRFALTRPEANRRVLIGLAAALILIALPPTPYLMSPVWLASMVTGWGSAALIAVLMILPLRRFASWPQVRISVERHKRLGELALLLAAAHTLLLIVGDKLMLEYLWPAQPRWMFAGNIGFIVLALLVVLSLERLRVLFGPGPRFRTVHIVLSVVLVALMAAHMVGSGIFIAHPLKAGLLALVSAALVAATFRPPVKPQRTRAGEAPHDREGAP